MLKQLRNARLSAGLTQKKMGELLGLTMAGYRQKEIGQRRITIDEAQAIAKLLNKSLDDIFLDEINQNDWKQAMKNKQLQI